MFGVVGIAGVGGGPVVVHGGFIKENRRPIAAALVGEGSSRQRENQASCARASIAFVRGMNRVVVGKMQEPSGDMGGVLEACT